MSKWDVRFWSSFGKKENVIVEAANMPEAVQVAKRKDSSFVKPLKVRMVKENA